MAGIKVSDFFKTQRTTSDIKSEILNQYFKAWAAILLKGQQYKRITNLFYIDLFAGTGLYDDGRPSTPIKILDSIYTSKGGNIDYDIVVKTFFNDVDTTVYNKLKNNILNLPYYDDLTNKPIITNEPASTSILNRIIDKNIPSLTFIDPLGYGYTQEMLISSIKDWGSDLFLLFNINRIRSAVVNDKVETNMSQIFSRNKLEEIQEFYNQNKSPLEREDYILYKFEEIFTSQGYKTLKFKINFPKKNQTSHYLFFFSKVDIAIRRAKEIMEKYSDYQQDGVPLFGANLKQDALFFPDIQKYSIDKLAKDILANVGLYNNLTIKEVYEKHHYGTNYIKPNYKSAIQKLLQSKQIQVLDKKNQVTNKITYTAKITLK